MASVYPKQGKYWLHYLDPTTGEWCDKPTPLRVPHDARKARQLKLITTTAEMKHQRGHKISHRERWNAWVPGYLKQRYNEGKTYNKYVNSWTHLEGFMEFKKITVPAQWKAEHNAAYVDWKEEAGYDRNAAIWDLGALAMLMNEAVRRDFITEHKVSKARIRKGAKDEKPALTNDQIAKIRAAIINQEATTKTVEHKRAWHNLAIAFEIALGTGCRIAETSFALHYFNADRGTITLIPKGGKEQMFTVPLIFPEFRTWMISHCEKRKKDGHKTTCDLGGGASRDFGRLCRKLKLKGPEGEKVTFHCTRVNFITRCLEAGLDSEVVRKLVKHADAIINRLYQRFSIGALQELGEKHRPKIPVVAGIPVVSTDKPSSTPTPPLKVSSRQLRAGRRSAIGKPSGKNSRAQPPVPAG